MTTNPFKPPETDSTKNPPPPGTPGQPLLAVLAGLAVDIGGSAVVGFAIGVIHVASLAAQGLTEAQVQEALAQFPRDSPLSIAATLIGALLSVLGGYVCGRMARRVEYRAGLAMAAVSTVYGLLMAQAAHETGEMTLLLTAATVACNLLGVKYGAEHNRRAEARRGTDGDSAAP
jgi:hypothetical protein